ncbi:Cupin domain protein [Rubripirellula lacrimiformis]|uniref:Cupin domain protein n=1 Tax=Rubripirellula lacrimiformis TaxID=1930273 RepID=A0A517ND42_9BACT|nr:cupin domain-containing protein [Rubripirellula lacrimiformis]QDT05026.1 Cupin domain protein [Rubripirellula lacrimiformis]
MAIQHAKAGQVIHVQPLAAKIASTKTYTLFKTEVMEAIRLVMPAGKKIAEHQAPGEITVQCLEGRVKFSVGQACHDLNAGDMLYLETGQPHALEAILDSSVLVTILLNKAS